MNTINQNKWLPIPVPTITNSSELNSKLPECLIKFRSIKSENSNSDITEAGITIDTHDDVFGPATDFIIQQMAVLNHILIWGDYDVDGMTSTASLLECLRAAFVVSRMNQGTREDIAKGESLEFIKYALPNRLSEGYGINVETVLSILPAGGLIITVDTGISNVREVEQLKEHGYRVIITDHHLGDKDNVPDADFIVSFKSKYGTNEDGEFYHAPGVYVAARLGIGILNKMPTPEDVLYECTEYCNMLVAMGIISDLVKLTPELRNQLNHGLVSMNNTSHLGIRNLLSMNYIGVDKPVTATQLAYMIIPKLNSAGRMGEPSLGVQLLTENYNQTSAETICKSLAALNAARKDIEQLIFEEAVVQAEKLLTVYPNSLVVFQESWHHGVVGIIASRLLEQFGVPTIVMSIVGNTVKGSGRSTDTVDLHGTLLKMEDKFIKFGGHAQAIGIELELSQIDEFRKVFDNQIKESESDVSLVFNTSGVITIEDALNVRFQLGLQEFEPYGKGNEIPIFHIQNVFVEKVEFNKGNCKLLIADKDDNRMLLSKFRAPLSYKQYLNTNIEVLVSPNWTYFTGGTNTEWKIIDIRSQ